MGMAKDPDLGQWDVPLNGSESAAVSAVKKQMKKAGLQPKDAGVRKLVREVREKLK